MCNTCQADGGWPILCVSKGWGRDDRMAHVFNRRAMIPSHFTSARQISPVPIPFIPTGAASIDHFTNLAIRWVAHPLRQQSRVAHVLKRGAMIRGVALVSTRWPRFSNLGAVLIIRQLRRNSIFLPNALNPFLSRFNPPLLIGQNAQICARP